jgi:hypothetical protein
MRIATQIQMPEIHCSNGFLVWNLFMFLHFFGVTDSKRSFWIWQLLVQSVFKISGNFMLEVRFCKGSSKSEHGSYSWFLRFFAVSKSQKIRKSFFHKNHAFWSNALDNVWVNNSHPHHHTRASLIAIWDMGTTNSARYLEHVQKHL